MKNYLVRAVGIDTSILGLACVTTELVALACRLHSTSPTASAALGRALTGGVLMASLLKEGQRLALKIEANGPLKKLIVEAEHSGNVRGFVACPDVDLPPREGKLDVAGAIGQEGYLTVVKDFGLGKPYTGIVKLRTGGIAEDIAYYYAESEQIPTAVGLGVFVDMGGTITAAGGFLVQTLPHTSEDIVDQLISRLREMSTVTQHIRSGKSPEDMLEYIFEGIPYKILEKKELFLRCACSREKIRRVLLALGHDELTTLITDRGETDVMCEFCRTQYHFSQKDLQQLLEEIDARSCQDHSDTD